MISYIIVNYETFFYTKNAIKSISKNTLNMDYEIILVDNNSQDDCIDRLRIEFQELILNNILIIIESDINGGFAYGNNLGYKYTSGEYIVLLNSDAEIIGSVVENSIKRISSESEIGALTARVIDGFGELDSSCKRGFPDPLNSLIYFLNLSKFFLTDSNITKYKLDNLNEFEIHSVDVISGAFMVIPRIVIEKVGFFDEVFFMYGEDIDLCYRIKEVGYRVEYNPYIGTVRHYKGQSSKNLKWKSNYEFFRAMRIFYDKHYNNKYSYALKYIVYGGTWLLFFFKMTIGQLLSRID